MPDAVIGPDCQLGQNVFVDAGVTIGRGCKLQNNVSICRYVTLADGVFCGPSCTFTNDRRPRAELKNWKPESTVVELGATIGANATVVCGVRIGRYAMIGAGAVVTKDVKAFALVYGNPAVQRGWVNDKRDKLTADLVCPRTGKRFVVDGSGRLVPAASVAGVEVTPGFPRAKDDGDVDERLRLLPETTDGETNRKSWLYLAASDGDQLDDSFQPSSAATDKENAINPDPNKTVSVIDICDGFRFSEDSSNKETNCESLLNQEDTNRISHNPRLETPTASADGDISPAPITFAGLDRQLKAIEKSLKSRVMSVIDNCQFIFGPDVALLEGELSRFCGCKHAVTCASGTDALRLALTAKGATRPHQAVFVPANTFCATVEAVVTTGATPVFVDVHRDTFNMDETSLLKAIELATRNGLRPTGVVAVDLYGQPADYDAIDAFARVNDLWVVADAAQSFGAERNGVKVGNLCEITTTSFYPAKALGCYGDGGAVFTNSDELAAAVRSLRAHGRSPRHKYHIERVGMNSRLDTVQAAVLLEKLKIFPGEIESRRRVAERYCELLSPHGVATPTLPAGVSSSWTAYTVVLPADCDRGRVVDDLHRRHRIQTNVYYKPGPLHELPAFADYLRPELTVSDAIQPRILSLPVHGYLRRDEVKRVAGALVESLRK
ncbi:UDP-2-acetamido-2-deoxy-3-oxo-D-glucuronate aminotransferase-like [Tubulanus polymorphus]|uniref:UDP-2-acetamido-2-deoxy-3-oxo-D-glucuronate aminotransferase-like n=1 Tax=Tubulanus polymorphus TaxID=672921 RepID=UPI003DA205D4